MKRLVPLLVLLLAAVPLWAQYDYFAYESGRFQAGMTVYVFSDQCALKSRAGEGGIDIDTLEQGEKLTVESMAMVETERNEIIQYWYQVKHTGDSGMSTSGYVCGHDLALGAVTFMIGYRRDLLLFQVTGAVAFENYVLTAKIVRNGRTVKLIETPFISFPANNSWPDYSISVLKNIQAGIDDKSEVAEINYFHEDLAFPSGILYLIWNGEDLDRICEAMYYKEEGLFEYDSYLVYPGRDGVKPGTVKLVETYSEYDETAEGYVETERTETFYRWENGKIVKN